MSSEAITAVGADQFGMRLAKTIGLPIDDLIGFEIRVYTDETVQVIARYHMHRRHFLDGLEFMKAYEVHEKGSIVDGHITEIAEAWLQRVREGRQ